jgi:adenylate cyclase
MAARGFLVDWRNRAIAAAALVAGLFVAFAYPFGFFDRPNWFASDLMRHYLTRPAGESQVVYLLITDETLVEADEVDGIQWPWPRQAYGEAIRFLADAGARAIVFDVTFSETSAFGTEDDAALAAAMQGRNVVLAMLSSAKPPVSSGARREASGERLASFAAAVQGTGPIPEYRQARPPVAELTATAAAVGDVKFLPDADGIGRRFLPLIRQGDRYYPSISLAAALRALGPTELELNADALVLRTGDTTRRIPLDARGTAWLKYYGDSDANRKYLLLRAIKSQVAKDQGAAPYYDPALFKDKVVVIASDATELKDVRPNPIRTANDVGAHYHGTAIANILNDDFLTPRLSSWQAVPAALLLGVAAAWFAVAWGGLAGALFSAALLLAYWSGAALLFRYGNTVIDVAAGTSALLLVTLAAALIDYLFEARQKLFVTSAFGQYLSPKVVSELIEDPARLKLGGETRVMTAFFSDIKGFSGISERLSPAELVALLNDYLTEMCDVIGAHEGTIDKFEGDAIMAFWGAPVPSAEHALQACRAALEMQARLVMLRERLAAEGRPPIVVRMGLNSGPMVVGNMGSRSKLNYTVMGDAVNLASRLEGANKFYGTGIMISEFTRELARDGIEVRELDLIRVVGKNEAIRIYELLALSGGVTPEVRRGVALFEEALGLYRARDFARAQALFDQVEQHLPDDAPARVYRERCAEFMREPPEQGWDGAFTAKAKG